MSYEVQYAVSIPVILLLGIYYLPRRNTNRCLHENLCVSVSSASIHNHLKLEATPVSLDWGMAEQTVVHNNGILTRNKKEWITDTYHAMDELF